MRIWVLFRTNPWHNYSSYEMIGVFDSIEESRKALVKAGANEEQIEQCLYSGLNQSQCNNTDFEFEKQSMDINEYML